MMKRILSFFLTVALSAALLAPGAAAVNEAVAKDTDWLYITIDPGHGGDGAGGYDPGAINSTYGYQEADRVLRIGLYLILSRLVDTFSSRILYPMLLLSGNHSIAVV